jgi:uncharacterized protein (DUF58 family)
MAEPTGEEGVYVQLEELVALRHSARRTSLLPRQPPNSLLAGRRASKLRGRGLDFEELRAYVVGDDVRSIDWRVTARMRTPYVRSYDEERDRPVLLVVDQRSSMFFGSKLALKSVVAARFAALAAWRVAAVGDRVAGLVVGDEQHRSLRPARSAASVLRLLELLVDAGRRLGAAQGASGSRTSDTFGAALRSVPSLLPHDGLVVLVSDLRGLSSDAAAALAQVRRHNDLLVAWVVDPLEAALPDVGLASVTDGDVELSLPTSEAGLRERFAEAFARDRARVAELCRSAGAPFFELGTDRPLLEQVESTFGRQDSPGGQRS